MKRRIYAEYDTGLYAFLNFNNFMEKIEAETCEGIPLSAPFFTRRIYHLGEPYFVTVVFVEFRGYKKMQPKTTIDLTGSSESINKLEEMVSEEAQRMKKVDKSS